MARFYGLRCDNPDFRALSGSFRRTWPAADLLRTFALLLLFIFVNKMSFVVLETAVKSLETSFPGYDVHNVALDGQCAFSAICHQLIANNYVSGEMTGDMVRKDVVDFVSNKEELKVTISNRLTDQSIDEYITDMRHKETWADENMLYAASLLYDVEIVVLRNESDSEPTRIGKSNNNRKIILGYTRCVPGENETHYVSLVPSTLTGLLFILVESLDVTTAGISLVFCIRFFARRSVCRSVTTVSCAKTAEQVELPLRTGIHRGSNAQYGLNLKVCNFALVLATNSPKKLRLVNFVFVLKHVHVLDSCHPYLYVTDEVLAKLAFTEGHRPIVKFSHYIWRIFVYIQPK